jgi:hypothetical protein
MIEMQKDPIYNAANDAARQLSDPWRSLIGDLEDLATNLPYITIDARNQPSALRKPMAGIGPRNQVVAILTQLVTDLEASPSLADAERGIVRWTKKTIAALQAL